MKLGKMLSVGEVVEHSAPEETTVAERAPLSTAPVSIAAESVTESADSAPTPAPVAVSGDR
jgi:hypothetical protein